jgi:ribonuclease J
MTSTPLRVIPLGGLGVIGKNMTVVEYGDALIIIDAGLMFPDEEMLGIDLVLPDFTYILENREKVLGVLLTHGHEDHVGALPYLLRQLDVPVYGTRLTLGLVNGKLGEHGLQGKVTLKEITPDMSLDLGPFQVEFLEVCHSIPDGVALAIHTPQGVVVHTGDFKLDQTPVDCRVTALHRFAELGNSGVLLLMSDSTNAEVAGFTEAERSVGRTLDSIFGQAPGRIIVASFASHIHRIQQVIDTAAHHGRNVAIVGRSMIRNVNIANNLGYLNVPEGIMVRLKDVPLLPDDRVVIISTGSQGEPMSALARMASHDHPLIEINRTDTVVISAKPVPGNERSVSRTIDRLFAAGANVIYGPISQVHVSGHAAAEELKMLLNVVRPHFFVPVHGEYRHLYFHAKLARETGIPADNIFIMENGDVLELTSDEARLAERVQAGMIFVDGMAMGNLRDLVLRDRSHLSTDGIVIVVVPVRAQDGALLGVPEVVFRGVAHSGDLEELAEAARNALTDALHTDELLETTDVSILKNHVHDVIQKYLYKETRRRPLVLPVIVEV